MSDLGSMPSLSVIVTCRNSAPTLTETLDAVVAQTYPAWWEVVVVDNASTDNTVEIAHRFDGKLPNYRVLRVPNPGYQPAGLNHGVEQTTGEVIVFLDSDDVIGQGYLERMGEALTSAPFVGAKLDIELLNSPENRRRRPPLQQVHIDTLGWRPAVIGATMGARRETINVVGGFDESLPAQHDLDISYRLAGLGIDAIFVPEAVLHYRYRATPRELFGQERSYGAGEVALYRKFRESGMPRRPVRQVVGSFVQLVAAIPGARRPGGRARLATVAGNTFGRLEGSLHYRRLYL